MLDVLWSVGIALSVHACVGVSAKMQDAAISSTQPQCQGSITQELIS